MKTKTTKSSKTAAGKHPKTRKEKKSQQKSKEGDGENDEDGDWLFDTEDLSPLRHISSPKGQVRVYKRQTTPYPEDISAATLEKENEMSARFRGSHDNELISEGDEWENGNQGKTKRFTRTYTLDDEGRKVQFQDDSQTQQRPSTEPSDYRKNSFKTRKHTPFPHEIEEANNLADEETSEEISQKKKSFQQRKHTPFPHEIEEEIKKSARYSSNESFTENDENHEENEDLLLPSLKEGEHDPEFDSYRQERSQHQSHNSQPSHLFANLDDEELHYPQSSDDPRRDYQQQQHHYEGSQSVPHQSMSRQISKRQSSADSFSSSHSQKNVRLRPITPEGHFRREYSKDHPLAGGTGKYSREVTKGKECMGPQALVKKKKPLRISEIVSKQEQKKLDLQRQLEELRKHQNEVLLEVLEEERKAELERVEMGRNVSDHEERRRYSRP